MNSKRTRRAEKKTRAILPESHHTSRSSVGIIAGLLAALSIGTFLRLYLLRDQILLDDEWHALNFAAINHSLSELLTHFTLNLATSIPLNVYAYLLLKTAGWNETLLRLPSIVAGLSSLVLFPILARNILNRRATLIFAILLAISPFLIFYSRMARPYSATTLLGFTSICAAYLWVAKGKSRYGVLYVSSGILAICFHLFAAIGVIMPLAVVFFAALYDKRRKGKSHDTYPSFGAMTIAGVLVAGVAAWFGISGLTSPEASTIVAKDRMTTASLAGFASLLSGTSNPACILLFVVFLGIGLFAIYKAKPLLGNIVAATALCYFVALILFQPASVRAAIVVSRYLILLFPLGFLAVAAGIDAVLEYVASRTPPGRTAFSQLALNAGWVVFVAALFVSGPLPRLYAKPNNFTNHSAFQESYKPLNWDQSYTSEIAKEFFSIERKRIPAFYSQLAKEPPLSIIEFPMSFVNQSNLYYYYQHFHRQRVLAGYLARIDVFKSPPLPWMDWALSLVSLVPEPKRFSFRNMVDLDDANAIKSSGAKYLILHNTLFYEEWTPHGNYPRQDPPAAIGPLAEHFSRTFGSPVFSDKDTVVFEIR